LCACDLRLNGVFVQIEAGKYLEMFWGSDLAQVVREDSDKGVANRASTPASLDEVGSRTQKNYSIASTANNSLASVTVGVCVKDSERTIQATLESIIRQTYPSNILELIIVDGASKDNTVSVIEKTLLTANQRARMFSDEGKGLGVASQIVMTNVSSKYVIFVGADVILPECFVIDEVEFMERNERVGCAVGRYKYESGGPLIAAAQDFYRYLIEEVWGDASVKGAAIFRVQAVKEAGGFDEGMKGAAEDNDLLIRLLGHGWVCTANPKAWFRHRSRQGVKEFIREYVWYGYGDHYYAHKHGIVLRSRFPIMTLVDLMSLASTGYGISHERRALLMPFVMGLGKTVWWFGFLRAHLDGYGHVFAHRQRSGDTRA
jgi:glycosyltransferase involved in cell wall biosynthesis